MNSTTHAAFTLYQQESTLRQRESELRRRNAERMSQTGVSTTRRIGPWPWVTARPGVSVRRIHPLSR